MLAQVKIVDFSEKQKMITLAKTIYFHKERDSKGYLYNNLLFNTGISLISPLSLLKIWSLAVNNKDLYLMRIPEILY